MNDTLTANAALKELEELKDMIANARGEQDVSKWEKDINSLHITANGQTPDYMEITEEAARIMKESALRNCILQ